MKYSKPLVKRRKLTVYLDGPDHCQAERVAAVKDESLSNLAKRAILKEILPKHAS